MQTNQPKSVADNVLLTSRDVHLLRLLYDHGMMSLRQVERFVFAEKAWPTILNRVGKLENQGFIKRIRVARLRDQNDGRNVGVVLQIMPRGILEMAKRHPEKDFGEQMPELRVSQLEHDLLLVDVIERLKLENSTTHFVDGRRFIRGKSEIHRVPDSVMMQPENSQVTAIELELTGKSEKRYRQIVLSYRLSRHFDRVLFVTASHSITRKIQSEILGYKVRENKNLDTGKFAFKNLVELLQDKTETKQ